jgi:hypothetical protein
MTARVAKKVVRRYWRSFPWTGRLTTFRRARHKGIRAWYRSKKHTAGHRWGRWDATLPTPPWEIPF